MSRNRCHNRQQKNLNSTFRNDCGNPATRMRNKFSVCYTRKFLAWQDYEVTRYKEHCPVWYKAETLSWNWAVKVRSNLPSSCPVSAPSSNCVSVTSFLNCLSNWRIKVGRMSPVHSRGTEGRNNYLHVNKIYFWNDFSTKRAKTQRTSVIIIGEVFKGKTLFSNIALNVAQHAYL